MNASTEYHVIPYQTSEFNPDRGVYRIGDGLMGGKGIGLARLHDRLTKHPPKYDGRPALRITVPGTVVVATDLFDRFMQQNKLSPEAMAHLPDDVIGQRFAESRLPETLIEQLRSYLEQTAYPLAVRSSSLMEDDLRHGYAGLYRSHMLPNDQPDPGQRLDHLQEAIKQVYASTYFADPRAYARRMGHLTGQEKMAVVIQQLVGRRYGKLFYPAVAGVVQSENDYPLPPMRREYGLATIAMGLGITVAHGERSMRFCPRLPRALPQRESDQAVMENSQRHFYALAMGAGAGRADTPGREALVRVHVADAADAPPMQWVASTWVADEQRLRDSVRMPGPRVVTFAPLLKYERLPLAGALCDLLDIGRDLMGTAVELEFALNLGETADQPAVLAILQVRPMTARPFAAPAKIDEGEIQRAVCVSQRALGNTVDRTMRDVVLVKPDQFDPAETRAMADQVARINARLGQQNRRYVLIGPGRWGSQDPWLGIPVRWQHISHVGAIVETSSQRLHAELSQGAHLYNNLAAAGISYLCVSPHPPDRIDHRWLARQSPVSETRFLAHVHLPRPLTVKVDAGRTLGIILMEDEPIPSFNH